MERLGAELYCWAELPVDAWLVLAGWAQLLHGAVFAGSTAAWMHGLDFSPLTPVEVILPPRTAARSRTGLTVHRSALEPRDEVMVRSFRVTSVHRTLLDLVMRQTDVEALVAIDMAVHRGRTTVLDLWRYSQQRRPGAARLRRLARLAEPAESPMETRLRWLLMEAGLPRPQVQAELRDDGGLFLGRADLYYRSARMIVEFDGGNHRDRLVSDDRRQNLLISAGYRILRFTSADLRNNPALVIAQVRAGLDTHSWRQTSA